jgi:hypothetical protein
MPTPFEGGCRCRAIRYRCTSEPAVVINCYCRDCQYASGGACTTALVVAAADVKIEGSPATFTVEAESGTRVNRLFCPTCGSPLFASNPDTSALFAIKAATLDDPGWLRPGAEIWTRSAPAWARMAEELPQYAKNFGSS